MIFVSLVALLVATAAGIVEVQETSTAKNMKDENEDEGEEVFHNVARADSVVEEKEEIGEDRDSCKIKDTVEDIV